MCSDAPAIEVSLKVAEDEEAATAVSKVAVVVAVMVGAVSAVVALASFWIARERLRRRQLASGRFKAQTRSVKRLMSSLVHQVGDSASRQLEELAKLKELAFVITDLENSTGIANAAPRAYEKVQDAHDSLLRELIARHGGYEINTEGDAFHVAFKGCAAAVHFCMEVQYQMMEQEWPREVLKLPGCKEVRGVDGWLAYRGPRVRMGIHWAAEGTVVQRLHQLTKHRVFTGPAFQVSRELCEGARGGQVLLSHDAWEQVRHDMASAGFPVVEQLGLCRVRSWPLPMWVYQAVQLVGRPLLRKAPVGTPALGMQMVEAGRGLAVVPPLSALSGKSTLAFVCCRLAAPAEAAVKMKKGAIAGAVTGSAGAAIVPAVDVPPAGLVQMVGETLAAVAMQFEGCIFRIAGPSGRVLIAFCDSLDAVRFCHAAQVVLLHSSWSAEFADWMGKAENSPGSPNKPLWRGPRVAMAVHESPDFAAVLAPAPKTSSEGGSDSAGQGNSAVSTAVDYVGPAERTVSALCNVAHGGQVVLSEAAWAAVQDRLPGQPQVVSLGTHEAEGAGLSGPTLLMEVMPSVLARRVFPPPRGTILADPGYRNAPDPGSDDVAIVYMRICKPDEVREAEQAAQEVSDETILRVVTAYSIAVSRAVRAARDVLPAHGGYECKEPEPGKLTLAFASLADAVAWSCAVQRELLSVRWPSATLEWAQCREVAAPVVEAGAEETPPLWRGLRVQIGVASGSALSKAPLKTGRADYFGPVPNLAARLMGLAQPGQVLVDSHRVLSLRGLQWGEGDGAALQTSAGRVEVVQLGHFAVKVRVLSS
jgi:class 3 adenylate cyclase